MFPHAMYMCLFGCGRLVCGRHRGLMVSVLDSVRSCLGSSPDQGHCAVFLGKTLNSHSPSLHPSVLGFWGKGLVFLHFMGLD